MAKMFYTLEEAASKLGKSEQAVKDLVAKGQIQEFRDRDRVMFKVDQIDLLAGGDDFIPLAESGEHDAIGLASSGTGIPLDPSKSAVRDATKDAKEGTGISIFELESTEETDANAVTRITTSPSAGFKDPGSSGSGSRAGLMDLTKEPDDTSLGAGLLEDVYGSETVAQQTAVETSPVGAGEAGALFEAPTASAFEPAAGAGAMMMIAAEPYDGPWSGLLGGITLGAGVVVCLAMFATVVGLAGASGSGMMSSFAGFLGNNIFAVAGGGIGLCLLFGGIGWLLGKKS